MLILYFSLSVLLMILIPVALAALLRRRSQVPWILFAAGTTTFIASQVAHLPLNDLLVTLRVLPKTGVSDPSISLVQTSIVLGLTAGLCEETARAVGYWVLKRFRALEDGIMLGLGHGGVEAMIFGGVLTAATVSALIPLIGTDLGKLGLTPDQLTALTGQLQSLTASPISGAAGPLAERLLAMTAHLIFSLLVLEAFRRRNPLYYVGAVAYHLLIDASAVYVSTKITNHNLVLAGFALELLPGMVWLVWRWRKEARPAPAYLAPASADLAIFGAALRKEIVQAWRTRRFLVVMAVFVLFGLTSPLAAKFTPEIIKSIAGAAQYANLIPTSTVADAMGQYIKNITQFGFILAVLLGMSAVAGEKESGTAAMVLSKPMPRWAFVLSKFGAQALVYLAAFLVAGLGAYYYTRLLFGRFDALKFTAINLLLLLWLLTFVGAALLGSVVGVSTAAAAGVGLGLSVVFLLAGSIPMVGSLMPSGLMAWAAQIGANSDKIAANGGALAAGLVLIVLCLVWSVALFERQEI